MSRAWCGQQDLNLHGCPSDPKSDASANSAMSARSTVILYHSPVKIASVFICERSYDFLLVMLDKYRKKV